MPRVHHVKAQKDYPDHGVKKGDMCYVWSLKTGPRSSRSFRQIARPKPQQLTTSAYRIATLDLGDRISALKADDNLVDEIKAIAEDIRNLGQEEEDKFDALPENFQNGSTGEALQEHATDCEQAADELESIADDADLPEQGDEDKDGADPESDEDFAERKQAKLDELLSLASGVSIG